MKYISTRGQKQQLSFTETLLTGLAPDGGLYVPVEFPSFSESDLKKMAKMDYAELAYNIMLPFIGDTIEPDIFKNIIQETYCNFNHPAIAPLVQTQKNEWILELYHGPTLAFKDFALQLLGKLLEHTITKSQEKVVILGATSGDTR
ncbi:MAG: threonine synthase, partial [Pseudomonadota bacterium]